MRAGLIISCRQPSLVVLEAQPVTGARCDAAPSLSSLPEGGGAYSASWEPFSAGIRNWSVVGTLHGD